jgi:TPR repeat protein
LWKEKPMLNDSEAVRLLKISADQGNADAQYDLGLLYMNVHLSREQRGSSSPGLQEDWTDNDEAERFMRAAARQGHIGARQWLEGGAPSLPIAKWLYIRGWYKGKIPGAAWILGARQMPPR